MTQMKSAPINFEFLFFFLSYFDLCDWPFSYPFSLTLLPCLLAIRLSELFSCHVKHPRLSSLSIIPSSSPCLLSKFWHKCVAGLQQASLSKWNPPNRHCDCPHLCQTIQSKSWQVGVCVCKQLRMTSSSPKRSIQTVIFSAAIQGSVNVFVCASIRACVRVCVNCYYVFWWICVYKSGKRNINIINMEGWYLQGHAFVF